MRLFISGSAPLLEETFAAFEARTGQRILERYGMTETGMNTSNPLHGERRAGTVGLPLPGVEVRVADDGGRPLAPGEVGVLEVRGPNVFKGYWRMPEKTAEEFSADGFFITGDIGVIGEDGYVAIVGRAKDLIISRRPQRLSQGGREPDRRAAGRGGERCDRRAASRFRRGGRGSGRPRERRGDHRGDIVAAARAELAALQGPQARVLRRGAAAQRMGKVQKNVLRADYGETFT